MHGEAPPLCPALGEALLLPGVLLYLRVTHGSLLATSVLAIVSIWIAELILYVA
jgi:hypothetical protein